MEEKKIGYSDVKVEIICFAPEDIIVTSGNDIYEGECVPNN